MVSRTRLIIGLFALVLVIAGIAIWRERGRADEAIEHADKVERRLGLDAARVLTQTFEGAGALKVSELSGRVLARSDGKSGPFRNSQRTRAPYSVNYFVDMRGLRASDYRWNEEARIMVVDLPEIMVERPNLDMTRAEVEQDGFWVSRRSGIAMQKQAAQRLASAVDKTANSPENVAKAREFARKAVGNVVLAPLGAAGLNGVRVIVRLPGEAKPAGVTDEQWNVTRSLQEVLADPKYR